jgi:hypothetical protein
VLVKYEKRKTTQPFFLKKKRKAVYVAILFILLLISFIFGGIAHKNLFLHNAKLAVQENYRIPINYIKGVFFGDAKNMHINIKFKDYKKLELERSEGLKAGQMVSDKKYVPATINFNGSLYKVQLRLKGDEIDHIEGDKWSFRVRVKKNNTILGMKQFSLQDPKTRNYNFEWLHHKMLKREGLIGLRFDFVNIFVNGKDLGLFSLEEHFEKRLLENNNRKESVIIRFSEDLYMDNYKDYKGNMANYDVNSYLGSTIDAFHTKRINSSTHLTKLYNRASYLLNEFRRGEKNVEEVFDIDLLAKFFAVSDLLSTAHANRWTNRRYYYNPITDKLEPIGYDGNTGSQIDSLIYNYYDENLSKWRYQLNPVHQSSIFSNRSLLKKYMMELEKISEKSYVDDFFNDISRESKRKKNILYSEFPYKNFDMRDRIEGNRLFIEKMLNPKTALQSYLLKKSKNSVYLLIANIQSLPIVIESVVLNDKLHLYPNKEAFLDGKLHSDSLSYNEYSFIGKTKQNLSDIPIEKISVNYKIYGTNKHQIHDKVILKNPSFLTEKISGIPKPSLDSIKKIALIDEEKKKIIFNKDVVISYDVVIPEGYNIFIKKGVKIDFINKSTLISFSPLIALGTKSEPINIDSSDYTGEGLFVVNAKYKSKLDYVNFSNLSNPVINDWSLTSAVTFYNSNVDINNTSFVNNIRGDDYLNIVNSKFNISNTMFYNSKSDSFDSDFSQGVLYKSKFINSGNDAVDISSTKLLAKGVVINGANDKAFSIGEGSYAWIEDSKINNSHIGVASKDMSEVMLLNLDIVNNKIGVTAYQKKPEFGGGVISGNEVTMTGNTYNYLIEKSSSCSIDSNNVSTFFDKKELQDIVSSN